MTDKQILALKRGQSKRFLHAISSNLYILKHQYRGVLTDLELEKIINASRIVSNVLLEHQINTNSQFGFKPKKYKVDVVI